MSPSKGKAKAEGTDKSPRESQAGGLQDLREHGVSEKEDSGFTHREPGQGLQACLPAGQLGCWAPRCCAVHRLRALLFLVTLSHSSWPGLGLTVLPAHV